MSEGVAQTLEIEAGGKKWTLGRIGFEIRLDAADEIRKQRRIEFKHVMDVAKELSGEEKSNATLAAFDYLLRNITVSMRETGQWVDSPDGERHMLWKSLQKANKDATVADAAELLSAVNGEQYEQIAKFLTLGMIG